MRVPEQPLGGEVRLQPPERVRFRIARAGCRSGCGAERAADADGAPRTARDANGRPPKNGCGQYQADASPVAAATLLRSARVLGGVLILAIALCAAM